MISGRADWQRRLASGQDLTGAGLVLRLVVSPNTT
jgi:hypothetical protein